MRFLPIASLLLLAGSLGGGIALAQPRDPVLDTAPIVACDASAAGEAVANGIATEQLADGLDLAILAAEATDAWPGFASGLSLTLRRLNLEPGVVSETGKTNGPLLYFMEQGAASISINGQPAMLRAGEVVLVPSGKYFQLRNDGDAAARLLRVQIVKPGDETRVSTGTWGDPANVTEVERESPPGPPYISSRLLLYGNIPAMKGSQRVILGCLVWRAGDAETGTVIQPGPVGFMVLRGEMLVNDNGRRDAGECSGFQAGAPHRLRAGAELPVVLVVAVVPGEGSWWGRGSARDVNSRLRIGCDAPAASAGGS